MTTTEMSLCPNTPMVLDRANGAGGVVPAPLLLRQLAFVVVNSRRGAGVGQNKYVGGDKRRTPHRKIRHQFRGCKHTSLVSSADVVDEGSHRCTVANSLPTGFHAQASQWGSG
jgi:hypothetical protein